MSGIDIEVKENKLSGLASDLDSVYTKLSRIRSNLESSLSGIRANWKDSAVEEYSVKFEDANEQMWNLIVAVDSMECFLREAAQEYKAVDNQIMSL